MIRLKDKNITVELSMKVWDGNSYSPDWSADFFDVGCLKYDYVNDAYIVDDVTYCLDAAKEWEKEDPEHNSVII